MTSGRIPSASSRTGRPTTPTRRAADALIAAGLGLLLAACAAPAPSPTSTPSPAPTTTPTQAGTPPATAAATITPRPALAWADPDKLIFLGHYIGPWSPTADELALSNCFGYVTDEYSLYRAGAPGFKLVPIDLLNYYCGTYTPSIWSPDGKQIAYPGVAAQPDTSFGYTDAWIVSRDGVDPHRVTDEDTHTQWYTSFLGWLGASTLAIQGYAGDGTHELALVNVDSKKITASGLVKGGFDQIGRQYIPLETYPNGTLFVMSQTRQPALPPSAEVLQGDYFQFGPGIPAPKALADEWWHARFAGWQSGTDTMAVVMYSFAGDNPPRWVSRLLLWDVPAGDVRPLVDGVDGHFSPDGRRLAYLTLGAPVPGSIGISGAPSAILSNKDMVYLNLLDRDTSRSIASLPVGHAELDPFGYDNFPIGWWYAFSPDSHALALIAEGAVRPDGGPIQTALQPGPDTLVVLDAQTGAIRFALPAARHTPVWSPDARMLVFWAAGDQLTLLDLATGRPARSRCPALAVSPAPAGPLQAATSASNTRTWISPAPRLPSYPSNPIDRSEKAGVRSHLGSTRAFPTASRTHPAVFRQNLPPVRPILRINLRLVWSDSHGNPGAF